MTINLSATALKDIRQCISQTLADTFQMMFHLDVFLLPMSPYHGNSALSSYIYLTGKNARAVLSISMDEPLAQFLAAELCAPMQPASPHVAQDIVCEVVNIIGNRVRSYIHDQMETNLTIGLPTIGTPPATVGATNELRIHFRIREADQVCVDFTYAPAAIRA